MSAIAGIVHNDGQQALWEDSWRLYASLGHVPADTTGVCKVLEVFRCHAQWITPESVSEKLPLYDEESGRTITVQWLFWITGLQFNYRSPELNWLCWRIVN